MSIDTTNLNGLSPLSATQSSSTPSKSEPPALSSKATAATPSQGAPAASPADSPRSNSQANPAAAAADPNAARPTQKASADSIIQAILASAEESDGKLPLKFSVDPTVLTKEVARKMAEKLQRTIEETMLLEKMRANEAASAPSEESTAPAPVDGAAEPSSSYDVIRTASR